MSGPRRRRGAGQPLTSRRHETLTIDRVGARGDGVGAGREGSVYVPLTLPGETVEARIVSRRADGFAAEPIEVTIQSPERVEPPCPHFGPCGGCALQHWDRDGYRAWKRALVVTALARAGLADVAVASLVASAPGSRRRLDLAARRLADGVVLGLHERGGHRIVDLTECRVMAPPLAGLMGPLRNLLAALLPPAAGGGARGTLTETGIDLLLEVPAMPDLKGRERLAAFAEDADLARLSLVVAGAPPEPVAERRAPVLTWGGHPVTPPPGGFVQATAVGEATLTERAVAAAETALAAGARPSIADLFTGAGTFALPLARLAPVVAVEGDAAALAALAAAGHARITPLRRDLFDDPLRPEELARHGVVLLDPPRAGAKAQAERLAVSAVPTVIAVSCNPFTFARDAAILTKGGYRLNAVTPVDQFLWSPHVELVGVFTRSSGGR